MQEDIEGLIHVSEISSKADQENPSNTYKEGEKVKAVVVSMDSTERKMSLSIKVLEEGRADEIAKQAQQKKKETSAPTLGDLMGEEFKSMGKKEDAPSSDES